MYWFERMLQNSFASIIFVSVIAIGHEVTSRFLELHFGRLASTSNECSIVEEIKMGQYNLLWGGDCLLIFTSQACQCF